MTSKKSLLADETSEQRTTRLEHKSVLQRKQLTDESSEKRAARLEHKSKSRRTRQPAHISNNTSYPILEDNNVKERMTKFSQVMNAIESPVCTVCYEKFPSTRMTSLSTLCQRCHRDKRNPKLYSSGNSMHPWTVPEELQVSSSVDIFCC